MAGFVFQLIIMIKQERAVAYKRLVAKFYNKKFLNCVNLMRYYKVIPKILLITSLIASHSFAISLNTPLIQTNVFRESMETNVDTSKAAPDNAWKALVGPISSVMVLGGIMALPINIARYADNGEEGPKNKEKEGIVISSVMLALGITGLVFAITF